jgi:hypothetical protein
MPPPLAALRANAADGLRAMAVPCIAALPGIAALPCIAALLCIAALAGCTGSGPQAPQWVSSGVAPDAYPPARYVIGIGSGRDSQSAAAGARGEIARTFRAHIQQEIADRQSSRASAGREVSFQDIDAKTRIKTDVMLEGVRIAETWRDPGSSRYWALAVLDRSQERARIQERYERESERLTRAMSDVSGAHRPEHKLAALIRARDAARALDQPSAGLVMLGGSRPQLDPTLPTVAALDGRLADLRQQLPIRIDAAEIDLASRRRVGELKALRVELSEAVTELGFPISHGGPGNVPWLEVDSQLGIAHQPELSSEYVVYRWEGGFELRQSTRSGSVVLGVVNEHGRITHSDDRRARLSAQREAQLILAERLKQWLADLGASASRSQNGAANP